MDPKQPARGDASQGEPIDDIGHQGGERMAPVVGLRAGTASKAAPDEVSPGEDDAQLRDVLELLRSRTGRDFAAYKRATVLRRIGRRMQANGVGTLPEYLECLRTRPGEPAALLQDMLVAVTSFFRDADCFTALEARIPALFRDKGPGDSVRAWVSGCATGEEAYSVAMLLAEYARTLDAPPGLQIFATDLDEAAIAAAREAVYPPAIEADVGQDRLRRFFVPDPRGWRVRGELRDCVLFAVHDVLKDPPFSRLDLVSCRNLLIYLDRGAQAQVLDTFRFALGPAGLLMLGGAESADDAAQLFSPVDKEHGLYEQRCAPRLAAPAAAGPAGGSLSQQGRGAAAPGPDADAQVRGEQRMAGGSAVPAGSWSELHLRVIEHLAPPSVLVDAEHDIVHLSHGAGRFLQVAGGEPTHNLARMVHPALRVELRAALFQASQSGQPVEVENVALQLGAEHLLLTLRVVPFNEGGLDLFLVLFQPQAANTARQAPQRRRAEPDRAAQHLDRELDRTRSQLRDTVERYEASSGDLKASNEELRATNEELRSTTQDLQASREELQSANQELTTVNTELRSRLQELGQANSDMQNLMDATAIATVFLDRDLRITRSTPAAVDLFNLAAADVGRPLAEVTAALDYPQLAADAARVLERLIPVEREVGHAEGNWYLARLLPYRTMDDRIAGVVLSFVDITQRKQAEEVRRWLSAVVNASTDAIISFSMDGMVLSWNGGAERILGYEGAEAIGRHLSFLSPGRAELADEFLRRVAAGESLQQDMVRQRKDGAEVHLAVSVSPIHEADGRVIGGTAIARDIGEQRAAREALRASEERLRLVVENARDYAIFSIDLERRVTSWNRGAERLLGYAEAEVIGQTADLIFTDSDRAAGAPEQEMHTTITEGRASDDRLHQRKDGSLFWASGLSMLMRDGQGAAVGAVKVLRDQTAERDSRQALEASQSELIQALAETQRARQQLEMADAAKDRFLAVLSHELRNPLASIASASELLMMPKLPEAALEKAAQVVQRQARAMKVLLDELLDVSRLSLGRLTLTRRPVSIAHVVQSALETTKPLVQAAGHELVVELPPGTVEVDGDALRLAQVVSNLVGNAAKYTPEGGRIVVRAEVFHDEVVLTVEDNGIGMDPAEIDRMFDLFSQASGAVNRSNGGLGIGLALARNIVELHGGWIMASSAGPGQGSHLRVGLPLLRVAPAEAPVASPEPTPQPLKPAVAAEGELVLVADDNGDAAWGLAKLLELSGFRAVLARSGEEALAVAEQQRPAVALLDIGMPDLSGHDVARRLREREWGRAMILIAATGWGQEADIRESMQAGFDAHLTKPLNVGRIKSLIEELAARRGHG
jgi:two-component system, chemotaxis family, CheB/CheR fusion protein